MSAPTLTYVSGAELSAIGRKLIQKVAEYEHRLANGLDEHADHDVVIPEQVRLSRVESAGRVLRFPLLSLSSDQLKDWPEFRECVADGGRLVLEVHVSPTVEERVLDTPDASTPTVGDEAGTGIDSPSVSAAPFGGDAA